MGHIKNGMDGGGGEGGGDFESDFNSLYKVPSIVANRRA
jgi:hypothetical protein